MVECLKELGANRLKRMMIIMMLMLIIITRFKRPNKNIGTLVESESV